MTSRAASLLRAVASCAVISALATVAPLQSRSHQSAVVSVGISGETAPYPLSDAGGGLSLSVGVSPTIIEEDERSRFALRGDVQLNQYLNGLGTDLSAALAANASRALSERTTLRGSASMRTSRNMLRNYMTLRDDPLLPTLPPEIIVTDPTNFGRRIRSTTVSAGLGLDHALSPKDTISADIAASQVWTDRDGYSDYRFTNGRIGYTRKLSERTSVTAGASLGYADYIGTKVGDAVIASPQIGIEHALSDTMTVSASAGVSHYSINQADGTKSSGTSLAGQARLCKRAEFETYCLGASRSAQPTALGGISNLTNVQGNYSRQLSAKERLSVSAGYSHSDNNNFRLPTVDYLHVGATYDREINNRLRGFVTVGADKPFGENVSYKTNFRASVGVSYTIGDLR